MPVMDGYTATKIIRKMERYESIPIVAVTSYALEREYEKCIEVGMDDYLSKPINLDTFYETIQKWAIKEHRS